MPGRDAVRPRESNPAKGPPPVPPIVLGRAQQFQRSARKESAMAKFPIKPLVLAAITTGALAGISGSAAQAAVLQLVNASPATIEKFFASPCRRKSWGRDLTGGSAVPPNGSFSVDLPHGCYDLRVVTARGRECIINNAFLRGVKSWTITRQHLRACS
jgi:hypothetical protein